MLNKPYINVVLPISDMHSKFEAILMITWLITDMNRNLNTSVDDADNDDDNDDNDDDDARVIPLTHLSDELKNILLKAIYM